MIVLLKLFEHQIFVVRRDNIYDNIPMKYTLFFMTLCLLLSNSRAEQKAFEFKDLYAGAGTITQFVGRIQQDESGSTNSFDFNPYLTVGSEFHLYKDFSFTPEFAFTFPKDGRDPHMKKWTYWTQLLGVYSWRDFKFKFGPGLIMNRISSEGGSQTLNNGGSFSDFPMPKGSSTSTNMTLNFATEWRFIKEVSTRFEGQLVNLTDSDSRAFSYTISFYYHFGNELW